LGRVDGTVVVANPGGDLTVTLSGTRAMLGGPVHHVADLTWSGL
jgi:diaminopimelate epimerase